MQVLPICASVTLTVVCSGSHVHSQTGKSYTVCSELNERVVQQFLSGKIECIVVDGFETNLSHDSLVQFCKHVDMAGTDQGSEIRSDVITWLPTDSSLSSASVANRNLDPVVARDVDSVVKKMNGLHTILSSTDCPVDMPSHLQLSHFCSKDAKYVLHRDNKHKRFLNIDDDFVWFSKPEQSKRFITCVLYITPSDWNCHRGDGGVLRCYMGCEPQDDTGDTAHHTLDVEPNYGRLIIFKSEDLLHEVLPTRRPGRFALTAWLLRADN